MISLPLKNKPRSRSFIIALLVLAVMMPLWWQTGNRYREHLLNDKHARITSLLAVHSNFLSTALHQRLALLKELKVYVDAHIASGAEINPVKFTAFATDLCSGTNGIRSITVAPGGVTLFVYPIEGNESLAGQDLINDRRASVRTDVQRAIRSKKVVLSGPYALRQKGLQLVARQAVYRGENLWGIVSIDCDISPTFTEAALDPSPGGVELILQDRSGHILLGKKALLEENPIFDKVDLPDGSWKLAAAPLGGWDAAIEKPLLKYRGISLTILLLLIALLYLILSYRSFLKLAVQERTGDLQRSLMNHREEGENLSRRLVNLRRAMGGILEALALAVETKDSYTSGHQRRVADLARTIAMEMGLPEEELDGIRMAAVIHDIGKISLPAEILGKPAKLAEVEFNLIKTHPQKGYDILKEIDFPWPIARMVWQHHERMDGSGYPLGISGEEILLGARVLAVADVVEAMASQRSYREMPGLEKALEEIKAKREILYDPAVVDACLRIFKEKDFRLV